MKQQVILVTVFCLLACWQAEAAYPPNFQNVSGCLLNYMNDGQYRITFLDAPEEQSGQLAISKMSLDSSSSCTFLKLNFDVNDNNVQSISLEFTVRKSPNSGFWDVEKTTMKITPNNNQMIKSNTFELKPINDLFAPMSKSYSCSNLVLQNINPTKDGPHFKITLKRFQLQPFGDASPLYVFAPSRDCSTWLTMPQIMGFLLVLFIIFTALFGVYLLLELGNQQGDIKFSKQGGMLMNQAQLDATKAD